jgi:hypothetical protein
VAAQLARKMPLVHFPAGTRLEDWSDWTGLKSHEARGHVIGRKPFEKLRGRHVFVYGGPSCYYNNRCVGDAAMYFAPGAEAGKRGGATPFDSGSLEDTPPRLQPFRSKKSKLAERYRFFEKHQVPLGSWRSAFERWLAHSYDDPERYLDTRADRYEAGEPDRLKPAEILRHNGTRGRARYGEGECGDRRAWTWEIRVETALPFEKIALLHVPFDSIHRALDLADELRFRTGILPKVETLPRGTPASFQTIYEQSGAIIKKLVK